MKRKLICFLSGLVFISGCSSMTSYNASKWSKPGTEYFQIQKDFQDCKMYGVANSPSNPFIAIDLTSECMLSKGYTRN